jgi:hypothetical protein
VWQPGYRRGVVLSRAPGGLSHLFSREHAVCARTWKSKLKITRGLDEFVLQICILGPSARASLSAGASLIRQATSALEHTNAFAWWHVTRVNLIREMEGGSLVRNISKGEGGAPTHEQSS